MTATYKAIVYEGDVDAEEFIEIQNALVVDPKVIRETIQRSVEVSELKSIADSIVFVGPRYDKLRTKLEKRTSLTASTKQKILKRASQIEDFCNKHSVRGTQVQAAFPDLILSSRRKLLAKGVKLQRFVPDSVLPLEYQFPGVGPVLEEKYKTEDHYIQFTKDLTRILSQGRFSWNEAIVRNSLLWTIE